MDGKKARETWMAYESQRRGAVSLNEGRSSQVAPWDAHCVQRKIGELKIWE